MAADPGADLRAVATALGVEPGHHDVFGSWHDVGAATLVAVAGVAAGVPGAHGNDVVAAGRALLAARAARPLPPTLVAWDGDLGELEVRLAPAVDRVSLRLVPDRRCVALARASLGVAVDEPAGAEVVLARHALAVGASGGRRTWRIPLGTPELREALPEVFDPRALPVGRHHLELEAAGELHRAVVLAAPRRVVRLDPDERLWGVFAPVHALWSDARPEPHVGHLGRVGEWIHGLGGGVVSTLPLLAGYLDRPCDPSPYQPVSRRWWNETYLDLHARPELADCPDARTLLEEAAPVDPRAPFDAPGRAAVVRRVVGLLADHVDRTDGPLRRDLAAFVTAEPDVVRYARFRAMVERTGTGWHGWDGPARDGELPVAADHPAVRAHVYAQWAMGRQLDGLARGMASRGQRLNLDLALGAHAEGYDTWAERSLFGWGASVGAPPDEFFRGGQDWGFPPVLPLAGTEDGHAHLAACLAAHMRVAGMLRIDHVMGLHHLWWVPDGLGPTEGAYVRYPVDELVATVAIESHLAGCVVVGEDLGTVPDEVRRAMHDHGLHGMWVAEFAQPDGPGGRLRGPGPDVVASIDTHDTPPWASWVRAGDAELNRRLDLVPPDRAAADAARRATQVAALADELVERGLLAPHHRPLADTDEATLAGLEALLRLIGDSDAACVLVSLDDLVGQQEPQNVPGTSADRPNWVQRLDRSLGALEADERITTTLQALQHARLGSWGRTQA